MSVKPLPSARSAKPLRIAFVSLFVKKILWLKNEKQVRADCETFWQDGRQRCSTVSLSGEMCTHAAFPEAHEHASEGTMFVTCLCGRAQRVIADVFEASDARNRFHLEQTCCRERLASTRSLPASVSSSSSAACADPWHFVCLGEASDYVAAEGWCAVLVVWGKETRKKK
jgi:hypothetical protein